MIKDNFKVYFLYWYILIFIDDIIAVRQSILSETYVKFTSLVNFTQVLKFL